MNIKVHTPSSLKAGSGISSLKQFWLSLVATTISIALTFGTAGFIDYRKKQKEKREIVIMLMHDIKYSLDVAERCDAKLAQFTEKQIEVLKHPETFKTAGVRLTQLIPIFEYSTTAESIFKSNVETINTIGNVHFVECVSAFYDLRKSYKTDVVDAFFEEGEGLAIDYDKLAEFNSHMYRLISQRIIQDMRQQFNQCKQLMNVSDEELQAFSEERERLQEVTRDSIMEQKFQQTVIEDADYQQRLKQAVEEGKKK